MCQTEIVWISTYSLQIKQVQQSLFFILYTSCLIWTILFEGFNVGIYLLFLTHLLVFWVVFTFLVILTWIYWNTASWFNREFTNSKMSSTILKPYYFLNMTWGRRKNNTFFTYLNKKSDILPNILGKHICLFCCSWMGVSI